MGECEGQLLNKNCRPQYLNQNYCLIIKSKTANFAFINQKK